MGMSITFTPERPLRTRADGWTPVRQRMFIERLARTSSVVEAAEAVGLTTQSAYRFRKTPQGAGFALAWGLALKVVIKQLGDSAMSRAINGVSTPVFHRGEVCGERIVFNDRLLMFLLKHRDPLTYTDLAFTPGLQYEDPDEMRADLNEALDAISPPPPLPEWSEEAPPPVAAQPEDNLSLV